MTAEIDKPSVCDFRDSFPKRTLHAAYIGQQSTGLDSARLFADKIRRRFRMQAKHDDIHILDGRIVRARPCRTNDAAPECFQPRRFVAVHRVALQIGIAFQRQRHAAADQSQADKHDFHGQILP